MLDMKYIREHAAEVKENAKNRHVDVDVDALLEADQKRLELLKQVELVRKERNEVAEQMKSAAAEARPALIERGKRLKEEVGGLEKTLEELELSVRLILLQIPNRTHPDAPLTARLMPRTRKFQKSVRSRNSTLNRSHTLSWRKNMTSLTSTAALKLLARSFIS